MDTGHNENSEEIELIDVNAVPDGFVPSDEMMQIQLRHPDSQIIAHAFDEDGIEIDDLEKAETIRVVIIEGSTLLYEALLHRPKE